MTQEQKAKAYEEVREKIALRFGSNVAEEIFSEFEMSEDERIRKWLYSYFRSCFPTWIHPDITCEEILAWLEKQGAEPNWCHHKVDLSHCSEEYRKAYSDGWNNCNQQWIEKQVPIYEEKVLIGARKDIALSIMNFLDRNTLGMDLSSMECADLESAVVDSDWSKVYDYMKKKLEKQGEQKPTKWSEEDKKMMSSTVFYLNEFKEVYQEGVQKCILWLKSLKQRYTWKPSDEQMKALHDMNLTGNISYAGQGQTLIELYNDLKQLKKSFT